MCLKTHDTPHALNMTTMSSAKLILLEFQTLIHMTTRKIIHSALIGLAVVFFSNLIIGVFLHFGTKYYFFDIAHHYVGGFFIALFFYGYLYDTLIHPRISILKKWLFVVGATVLVGVVWEFAEFVGTDVMGNYLYANYNLLCCIGDLTDTLFDLLMDMSGAITLLLIVPLKKTAIICSE